MSLFHLFVVFLLFEFLTKIHGEYNEAEELEAEKYLKEVEDKLNSLCFKEVDALFHYNGDMKEETSELKAATAKENTAFKKKVQAEVLERFPNWKHYKKEQVRYQMKTFVSNGPANMSMDLMEKMKNKLNDIIKLQASATVCDKLNKTKCNLRMADILTILALNKNPETLEYYFTEWQNAVGKAITPSMYQEFVNLSNLYAIGNGFDNMFDMELTSFDDHTPNWTGVKFESELHSLLDGLQPYYQKLHAYIRMKLTKSRGSKLILPKDGYLPNHFVGSLFGDDMSPLATETMPFPNATISCVDQALHNQNYTAKRIMEAAERFFMSLNEEWKLPKSFWEKSLLERPADENKSVLCHPTAYDFCVKEDFRLHICSQISESNLKVAYHELGHIIYFRECQDLPYSFRAGANPGFHEAVGDTISLSVTRKHLKCSLGLINDDSIKCGHNLKSDDEHKITEEDVNVLHRSALAKIPVLFFGLVVDLWRGRVFAGKIKPPAYNSEWWQLREELQGIVPPSPRPSEYLDPMTLFHIANDMPYTSYIVAHILQYQFYEALCIAAGEYDDKDPKTPPLHRCDFSNSREAGKLLKNMLKQGASKDWRSILEEITGSRDLSLRPLLHYFQPLFDVIEKELKENNFPACFGKNC